MLLRDLQAATVLADIAAWIDAPATVLPSGADRAITVVNKRRGRTGSNKSLVQPRPLP